MQDFRDSRSDVGEPSYVESLWVDDQKAMGSSSPCVLTDRAVSPDNPGSWHEGLELPPLEIKEDLTPRRHPERRIQKPGRLTLTD